MSPEEQAALNETEVEFDFNESLMHCLKVDETPIYFKKRLQQAQEQEVERAASIHDGQALKSSLGETYK